jgi:MFS family permease
MQKGEEKMAGPQVPKDFQRVIIAAAVGNVIEWYDFYIFGSLAAVLSVKFFEQSHPVAALLSTIALFTAGFLIRPLGAFLFGWMGDRVGRKYTFLLTLSGMGLGTGCIGLIPTYAEIGLTAAFILFGLRMIQGLCLGGEYGGAITYVAEHVPDEHRGYYTGWLQTSTTRSTPGRGACRSWCPSCWSRSRSGSGCNCRRLRSSRRSGPKGR